MNITAKKSCIDQQDYNTKKENISSRDSQRDADNEIPMEIRLILRWLHEQCQLVYNLKSDTVYSCKCGCEKSIHKSRYTIDDPSVFMLNLGASYTLFFEFSIYMIIINLLIFGTSGCFDLVSYLYGNECASGKASAYCIPSVQTNLSVVNRDSSYAVLSSWIHFATTVVLCLFVLEFKRKFVKLKLQLDELAHRNLNVSLQTLIVQNVGLEDRDIKPLQHRKKCPLASLRMEKSPTLRSLLESSHEYLYDGVDELCYESSSSSSSDLSNNKKRLRKSRATANVHDLTDYELRRQQYRVLMRNNLIASINAHIEKSLQWTVKRIETHLDSSHVRINALLSQQIITDFFLAYIGNPDMFLKESKKSGGISDPAKVDAPGDSDAEPEYPSHSIVFAEKVIGKLFLLPPENEFVQLVNDYTRIKSHLRNVRDRRKKTSAVFANELSDSETNSLSSSVVMPSRAIQRTLSYVADKLVRIPSVISPSSVKIREEQRLKSRRGAFLKVQSEIENVDNLLRRDSISSLENPKAKRVQTGDSDCMPCQTFLGSQSVQVIPLYNFFPLVSESEYISKLRVYYSSRIMPSVMRTYLDKSVARLPNELIAKLKVSNSFIVVFPSNQMALDFILHTNVSRITKINIRVRFFIRKLVYMLNRCCCCCCRKTRNRTTLLPPRGSSVDTSPHPVANVHNYRDEVDSNKQGDSVDLCSSDGQFEREINKDKLDHVGTHSNLIIEKRVNNLIQFRKYCSFRHKVISAMPFFVDDVNWQNFGISSLVKIPRRIISLLFVNILFTVSALLVIIINVANKSLNLGKYEYHLMISILASIVLGICNAFISKIVYKLNIFELHSFKSLSIARVTQRITSSTLLNLILSTLAVNMIIDNIWGKNGLSDNTAIIFFVNAILPVITIFNPLWNYRKRATDTILRELAQARLKYMIHLDAGRCDFVECNLSRQRKKQSLLNSDHNHYSQEELLSIFETAFSPTTTNYQYDLHIRARLATNPIYLSSAAEFFESAKTKFSNLFLRSNLSNDPRVLQMRLTHCQQNFNDVHCRQEEFKKSDVCTEQKFCAEKDAFERFQQRIHHKEKTILENMRNPEFSIIDAYSFVARMSLASVFYSNISVLCVVITLLALMMHHVLIKHLIFRRCKVPLTVTSILASEMFVFIELVPVMYVIGSLFAKVLVSTPELHYKDFTPGHRDALPKSPFQISEDISDFDFGTTFVALFQRMIANLSTLFNYVIFNSNNVFSPLDYIQLVMAILTFLLDAMFIKIWIYFKINVVDKMMSLVNTTIFRAAADKYTPNAKKSSSPHSGVDNISNIAKKLNETTNKQASEPLLDVYRPLAIAFTYIRFNPLFRILIDSFRAYSNDQDSMQIHL